MNALLVPGAPAAMSTREIAELTGKRHDNVMADTRKMLVDLHGEDRLLSFQDTVERPNPSGGGALTSVVYMLPKRETLILVSGYSLPMRAKIIDRWTELEEKALPGVPRTFAQALRLAAEQQEEIEKQQALIEHQKPRVAFAEAVGASENDIKVGVAAKELGIGPRKLWAFLKDAGILMQNSLPYQQHIDAGRFRVVPVPYTAPDGEKRTRPETRVTGKGFTFLQQRLACGTDPPRNPARGEASVIGPTEASVKTTQLSHKELP